MNYETKEQIRELLLRNNKAVERGILALYQRQTADEQSTGDTRHHNGVGFNGTDAPLLSSFAQQIARGRTLTAKQMVYGRKKILKYSGQLLKIAQEKSAQKSPSAVSGAVEVVNEDLYWKQKAAELEVRTEEESYMREMQNEIQLERGMF